MNKTTTFNRVHWQWAWFLIILAWIALIIGGLYARRIEYPKGQASLPERAWLGIDAMNSPLGIIITEVVPNSPAHKAGLIRGDIIEGIDGSRISLLRDLDQLFNNLNTGDKIRIQIKRGGKKRVYRTRLTNYADMNIPYPGIENTWFKKALLMSGLFINSIVFSMVGLGGGVLNVPLLLTLGVDFHIASLVSLFLIMAASIAALTIFYRARLVDWRLAVCLEPFSLLGAFIGGFTAGMANDNLLSVLFAMVLFLSGFYLLSPALETAGGGSRKIQTLKLPLVDKGIWRIRFEGEEYNVNLWIGLPISFLAGLLSGSLGIAGGVLKIMLMVYAFGVPLKIAIGTSSMMVGFTAALGFFGNYVAGRELHYGLALLLAVIVIIGAQIGSRISVKINREILQKIFALIMLLVGVWMVMRAV